jgi:phosphoribosylaminoimidazole-succinocarboxamide synthase
MIGSLYRGSVKDLLGPVHLGQTQAVVFEFSDAYSVFDWGKMPDLLSRKGEALAVLTADFFEKFQKPEIWKEFSRSAEALALRKSNRFGGGFNEMGEELQSVGLGTHFLGVVDAPVAGRDMVPHLVDEMRAPFRHLAVVPVSVVKPRMSSVLGRTLPDYYPTRTSSLPRVVPLEVVFRFSCPEGSSLLQRTEQDPSYLASLGFGHLKAEVGQKWDFPVLELMTQLESVNRPVLLAEALALSGLSASQLQEVLFKTAWIAALLKYLCARRGFDLIEGKLEWALGADGKCFLVDSMGPDELRLFKGGVEISHDFLKTFYRRTRWYQALEAAKVQAKNLGHSEWRKLAQEAPPSLPSQYKELAIQSYLALTNELTGRKWFPDAWPLDQVVTRLRAL